MEGPTQAFRETPFCGVAPSLINFIKKKKKKLYAKNRNDHRLTVIPLFVSGVTFHETGVGAHEEREQGGMGTLDIYNLFIRDYSFEGLTFFFLIRNIPPINKIAN